MIPRTDSLIFIDIGGTWVRFGGPNSEAAPAITLPTPSSREDLLECLLGGIRQLSQDLVIAPQHIAVACPGLIDPSGKVVAALYVDISGLELARTLKSRLRLPVSVLNDANAQAMGCAGRDETLLYIAVGTGIGGAVVHAGRLVQGSRGFAGEVGHIQVGESLGRCRCGMTGCLDIVASGFWMEAALGAKWWERTGDDEAKQAVTRAGEYVARAALLGPVLLDADRVVVAGKATAHPDFVTGFEEVYSSCAWGATCVELVEDTWEFAVNGLKRIVLQDYEETREGTQGGA